MQVPQRNSIRQPVKTTSKKPSSNYMQQNDMASTTTEQSGTKSIPFPNTPKIKLKQNVTKSSQNKTKQPPSKHLYSPQQQPQYDLMNSPIQQEILQIVEPVEQMQQVQLKIQDQPQISPETQVSIRGLLQREFFSSEQVKQQQDQKKKMKDIWDQQIQEKQQRLQKEKEQRQLEQKLESERIQQEILKEQEELAQEKYRRQKYHQPITQSQLPSSPNNDLHKKSKIRTEARVSIKEPESFDYQIESPADDMLQQLIKQNEELKKENEKKDNMIEQLMKNTEKQEEKQALRLNSSKSTSFLIKTNSIRGLTKSSQEKKNSMQNRLPELTTPQPHFTHSKQIKSNNLEIKTQKNRMMLVKDEEQNWSFGRPEEISVHQQQQMIPKSINTQITQKMETNQDQQEQDMQQVQRCNEWVNLNPGFTFCSSITEQFKFNPKALSKIKSNTKLPKEFQVAPLKRKFFI